MSNTMQWPSPGLGHAPSYQVSGIPYATSSTVSGSTVVAVSFPFVTSWIVVKNLDNSKTMRLGFSQNGVNDGYYFLLDGGTNAKSFTPPINVKTSTIYLKSSDGSPVGFSVLAGLTSIPVSELSQTGPSGANWSGSSGVG